MMPARTTLVLAILGLSAVSAASAAGQERDAQVVRWGEVRLSVGGEFAHSDRRFGPGGPESLAADFSLPLTSVNFQPLVPVVSAVEGFLAATGGDTGLDPSGLSAGDLSLSIASRARAIPLEVAVGVFRRVQLGASLPIVRRERQVTRVGLAAGNVGINPNRELNALILGRVDPSGAVLGSAAVLPLASSALGVELRRRVLLRTGEEIQLPATALAATELLETYPVQPFPAAAAAWAPGDLQLNARVELLHSFSGLYYPPAPGFDYRLAVDGGIRLATGERQDPTFALAVGPEAGFTGLFGGGTLDLFYAEYLWVTTAVAWERLGGRDVTALPPPGMGWPLVGGPAIRYTRTPGARLAVGVNPRIRLTREFSAGAVLSHERLGSERIAFEDRSVDLGGRSLTSAGVTIRYSTLPAREAGQSILPLELTAGYAAGIAGSGGVPRVGTAYLRMSLLPRLWGGQPANETPPARRDPVALRPRLWGGRPANETP